MGTPISYDPIPATMVAVLRTRATPGTDGRRGKEEVVRQINLLGPPILLAALAAWLGWAWMPPPGATGLVSETVLENLDAATGNVATLPLKSGTPLEFHRVVVTGYSSEAEETDDSPFMTASMTTVRDGCIALSRDMLRTFTPGAPFDFGDYALIPGVGIFLVQDTMSPRWHGRADIWFADRGTAVSWGRRRVWLGRLPAAPQEQLGLLALGLRLDAPALEP